MESQLQQFLEDHQRIFVLTGAGISTASGIPDYRDESGQWKHQRPMEFSEFISRSEARQRYWSRSIVGWQRFFPAHPNAAHHALAQLEALGKIEMTVTQNVDGLHQKAGSRNVIELHGTLFSVSCLDCGFSMPRARMQQQLLETNSVLGQLRADIAPDGDAHLQDFDHRQIKIPGCPECDGTFKPDVVFFGENVPNERVDRCFDALATADAMLVVGSSLMVYSGFRFARKAHQLGLPIVAINLGKTRADELLDLKLEQDCADFLPGVINRIRPASTALSKSSRDIV